MPVVTCSCQQTLTVPGPGQYRCPRCKAVVVSPIEPSVLSEPAVSPTSTTSSLQALLSWLADQFRRPLVRVGTICLIAGLVVGVLCGGIVFGNAKRQRQQQRLIVQDRQEVRPVNRPVEVVHQPEDKPKPVVPQDNPAVKPVAKPVPKDEDADLTPRQKRSKELTIKANSCITAKNYTGALVAAAEALDLEPSNYVALYLRGLANASLACDPTLQWSDHGMSRLSKALVDLKAASDKDPEFRKMYELYRTAYIKQAALLGID